MTHTNPPLAEAARPQEILAGIVTAFTGCADRGAPLEGLQLCASGFRMGPEDALKDIEALRMVMTARAGATYETRHVIGYPTLTFADQGRIEGVVPVISYRRMPDGSSMAVSDFVVELVHEAERWLIQRLQLRNFLMQPL